MDKKDNVVLIGMPGAGKSTVGVVLAKKIGFQFVDSDLVIQEQTGKVLHELISEHGIKGFIEIENKINQSIECKNCVVATGGSVIYGSEAMVHLRSIGTVIYLKLSCKTIMERVGDLCERGVVTLKGQTLEELYQERIPLYEKYADIVYDCEGKQIREIVSDLVTYINK